MGVERERAYNPALEIVHKPVPYPHFFGVPETTPTLLKVNKGWNRWDATRRANPFIEEQGATGFEGYFVGVEGLLPQDVATKIAELGASALESFKRLHPGNPGFVGEVWKVARGDKFNLEILAELNACLLSNLARLRVQVLPQVNKVGSEFRQNIARQVQSENIYYHGSRIVTEHGIAVPKTKAPLQAQAITVTDQTFSTEKLRQGYAFMKLLGKAGYPLLQMELNKRR